MPATATPSISPGEHITVRMYRGLLGDCFLLTHTAPDRPEPYRVLIDCGVLQCIGKKGVKKQTERGLAQIHDVVASLMQDTGGVLDLVIATHEHYDHLSGFMLGYDALKTLQIRAVWMAWTEKPGDVEAETLRENGMRGLKALQSARTIAAQSLGPDDDRVSAIDSLLQFYDPAEVLALAPQKPGGRPRSCRDALEWLKFRAGYENVRYLEPGQVVRFGLGDRLCAHVMGPPRTARFLDQLNPSAGAAREVYLTERDEIAALESTLRIRLAAAGAGGDDRTAAMTADSPFSSRFLCPQQEIERFPTWKLYWPDGIEEPGILKGKSRRSELRRTRRIDDEWIGAAEHLALKIDGDVNNTSLALAIEVPGRHVLLFPGDAQVGNWLSWHEQTYPKGKRGAVTASDLLSRTVLYKVGHHASHNATAREKGLEMMTSPHLVAMIPVVEAVAKEQKTRSSPEGWAMPWGDLFTRLGQRTQNRIVRGDGSPARETEAFARVGSLFAVSYATGSPKDPLWVELRLLLV